MSKATTLLAIAGGGALLVGGAYLYARSQPKAEKTVPGAPPMVPVHPGVTGQPQAGTDRTSLCQVLTGYRSQLRRFQDLMADAQKKMRDLEPLAESACTIYAQTPVFQEHCHWTPFIGCNVNKWYTVSGTTTDANAKSVCLNYFRAGAGFSPRSHEKRKGDSWDDTWADIDRINAQIAQAYAQVQDLRKQYEAAQRQYEEARAQAMELERRIADLEAQGVFC